MMAAPATPAKASVPLRRLPLVSPPGLTCLLFAVAAAWGLSFVWRSAVWVDGRPVFHLFDDAMVSLTFAENLAEGHGLTWNGARVEGFSNPLMVFLMAGFGAFLDGSDLALAIQLFGILGWLGVGAIGYRIGRRLGAPGRSGFWGAAFALAYYPFAYWSLYGMETVLLGLAYGVGALLVLSQRHTQSRAVWLGLAWAGAFLARPDALAGFVPLALGFLWDLRKRPARQLLVHGAAILLPVAGVAALVFAARWTIYHDLVPNTYVLKLGIPWEHRLRNGLAFTLPVAIRLAVVGTLALALAPRSRWLVLTLVGLLAIQVWMGGDPWPYWRITAPVVPLLLAALGSQLPHLRANWPLPGKIPVAAAAASLLLVAALTQSQFLPEAVGAAPIYQADATGEQVRLAFALSRVLADNATVGVLWAGTIPFFTGLPAVDFLGKCDPVIAHGPPDLEQPSWLGMRGVPGHNKYNLSHSLGVLKPDFAQVVEWAGDRFSSPDVQYVPYDFHGTQVWFKAGSGKVRWDDLPLHGFQPAGGRP